jgi:patatin-related protein
MSQKNNVQFSSETRIALVMYGGISLAIYIYGVAQEFFSLVRATATQFEGNNEKYYHNKSERPLCGAEPIYREIGEELRSKFIVDILSGTSAGGLNAIFLAKALVNGSSFETLRNVWVDEGDINKLINDLDSVKNDDEDMLGLHKPDPDKYLLNGQRFYRKLYAALKDMDGESSNSKKNRVEPSVYVEELDLFSTATDFVGQRVKLNVNPGILEKPLERKHRDVFNFKYGERWDSEKKEPIMINEFNKDYNPLLAFAARATAAITPVIGSITIQDAIDWLPPKKGIKKSEVETLLKEKIDESTEGPMKLRFQKLIEEGGLRPFADGGYLDNKPFEYAIQTIEKRTTSNKVDRKLFYIEPAPERFNEGDDFSKPDVIDNTYKAIIGLPRYETISNDLVQIDERNNLLEKINDALSDVEKELIHIPDKKTLDIADRKKWQELYLDDCIEKVGPAYGLYLSLRLALVKDQIAGFLSRRDGHEVLSNEHIKNLVKVKEWVNQNFQSSRDPDKSNERAEEPAPYNKLLYSVDYSWRLRRISHLVKRTNSILEKLQDNVTLDEKDTKTPFGQLIAQMKQSLENQEKLISKSKKTKKRDEPLIYQMSWEDPDQKISQEELEKFCETRGELEDAIDLLKESGTTLTQESDSETDDEYTLFEAFSHALIKIRADFRRIELFIISEVEKFQQLEKEAATLSNDKDENIPIQQYYQKIFNILRCASWGMKFIFGLPIKDGKPSDCQFNELDFETHQWLIGDRGSGDDTEKITQTVKNALNLVRLMLYPDYIDYEYYDKLAFPTKGLHQIGEDDRIEVWRISPQDATLTIESNNSENSPIEKIGGEKYGHFGGFFSREWRESDIVWGRLDAAEMIIRAMTAEKRNIDEDKKIKWIKAAQTAILGDEQNRKDPQNDEDDLKRKWWGARVKEEIKRKLPKKKRKDIGSRDKFFREFRLADGPGPDELYSIAGRATDVLARIFKNLSNEYKFSDNKLASWLISLIKGVSILAKMLTPGSAWKLIFDNAGKYLILLGAISIVLYTIFNQGWLLFWGIVIILFPLLLGFVDYGIRKALKDNNQNWPPFVWALRIIGLVVAAFLLILITIGWSNLPDTCQDFISLISGWFN